MKQMHFYLKNVIKFKQQKFLLKYSNDMVMQGGANMCKLLSVNVYSWTQMTPDVSWISITPSINASLETSNQWKNQGESSSTTAEMQSTVFHIMVTWLQKWPSAAQERPTLFCFRALFSFMWGQSFPVTTDLMSDTGTATDRETDESVTDGCVCWGVSRGIVVTLTLVAEELKGNFTLRWLVQVAVMQNFVIQRQPAEPELLCWREGGFRRSVGGVSAQNQQDLHDATLAPPVPQFAEAASFTQSVESLLLDELQDLRLDSLPQLTAVQDKTSGEQR